MGKRTKKKMQQPQQGGIRSSSLSSTTSSSSTTAATASHQLADSSIPSMESGGAVSSSSSSSLVDISGVCPHAVNLEKLRTQLVKSSVIFCLDCAKLRSGGSSAGIGVGVAGVKERKGRAGKVAKKKLPVPSLASSPGGGVVGGAASKQHKLWICLSCGHVGCGLGNPKLISTAVAGGGGELNKQETKQGVVGRGHAWQHWLQLKHPRVMLCGDDFSCWCFVCERLQEVPHDHDAAAATSEIVESSLVVETREEDDNSGDNEEAASVPPPPPSRATLLQESEKLVREKLAVQFADAKDEDTREPVGESAEEEAAAEGPHRPPAVDNGGQVEKVEGEGNGDRDRDGEADSPPASKRRVMKGLTNLGNTCFFNSVMQNLLSLELLRRRFTGPDSSALPDGALTSSLKKFFLDASANSVPEADGSSEAVGVRRSARTRGGWTSIDGAYNPKSLFGAICQKAPRFKGCQQQDSHELFKALLDGLQTEEPQLTSKKAKTGGGEDALRALSESEAHEYGIRTAAEKGDDDHQEDTEAGRREDATEQQQQKTSPKGGGMETFVERVFGGKLSTTVSCCECGHSSIKYESFLDLSLPIPSKKPTLSKKGSASGKGSSAGVSQSKSSSQRVQALKSGSSKASSCSRADPDLDVFKSVPAGLGTPLFLLPPPPPPPPKDKRVQSTAPPPNSGSGLRDSANGAGGGWLDYLDVTGGGSSEQPDWLAFADEDATGVGSGEEVESGCSRNPEQSGPPNGGSGLGNGGNGTAGGFVDYLDIAGGRSSEQPEWLAFADGDATGLGSGEEVSNFSSSPKQQKLLLAQSSGIAAFPESDSKTKISAAYVSQSISVVEQNGGGHNTSACEKQGFLVQQPPAETLLLGGGDANGNYSSGVGLVQIRGGSEIEMREEFNSSNSHEPEMDTFRAADDDEQQPSNNNNESDIGGCSSVEQSGDGNDDTTEVQSDINNGPGGMVILLGPPPPAADSSGSADGDFDGVGSLFEEDNNNEGGIQYGPLPLTNGDGTDLDDSTYDEVIFDDDVLDMSKINTDGKADWLVVNEDGGQHQQQGQGDADENDGVAAMSIEGCLQTYTKSELLTGDNAWACDNCTKLYFEKVAVVALAVSSPRLHQESSSSLGIDASVDAPELGINGFDKTGNSTGISTSHCAHELDCNGNPPENGFASRKPEGGQKAAPKSQERDSCMNCSTSFIDDSEGVGLPSNGVKDEPLSSKKGDEEADKEQQQPLPDSAFRVNNGSTQSGESDSKGGASRSELDGGERIPNGGQTGSSESQAESSAGRPPVSCDLKPEVEANVGEVETKGNSRSSSGKTLKLKKSKSRGRLPGAVEPPKRVEIKRDATKRDLISKSPLVLTLQLKRFAQDMRGRLSKLSGHVAFQEYLDLYPFLDRRHVNTEYKYRLVGTVEHSGTLKSGHYVAFVRGPPARSTNASSGLESNNDETMATNGGSSSWYYISDEHVHPTNLEAVLRSEAYLLFYERVDVTGAATPLL